MWILSVKNHNYIVTMKLAKKLEVSFFPQMAPKQAQFFSSQELERHQESMLFIDYNGEFSLCGLRWTSTPKQKANIWIWTVSHLLLSCRTQRNRIRKKHISIWNIRETTFMWQREFRQRMRIRKLWMWSCQWRRIIPQSRDPISNIALLCELWWKQRQYW